MSRINENLVDADSNGTFKRSFSLPAVRRKKVTNNHSLTTNDENAHSLENGNAQHNRVWLRTNRAVSGRKGEIRVSRFNPVGIDLPLDLLTQIKQSETRNNIKNGGHPQTTMPQKPIRAAEKVEKRKDNNGFVKKLNSVCRIRSFTNKDTRTCCIKNVEIHRNPNETLGIFIKKRKISRGTHFSVFPDGTRCKEGIFISRLAPKCKAVDLVNPGDQLLAINSIEVSHLGVKIVAALMAMPSLLALTIKTPHTNENGHIVSTSSISSDTTSLESSMPQKFPNKASMAPVPEDRLLTTYPDSGMHRNNNFSVLCENKAINSVYDNTIISSENTPKPLPEKMSDRKASLTGNSTGYSAVQDKFDESFQILLSAIAICDKPINTNNNSSMKTPPLPPKLNAKQRVTQESEVKSNGYGSLLDEILTTVARYEENGKWKFKEKLGNKENLQNITSTSVESIDRISEPDYDDVAESDGESSLSSCMGEEISVDVFLKPGTSVSSSSSSVSSALNTDSSEASMNQHNFDKTSSIAPQRNNIKPIINTTQINGIPRFPISHFDNHQVELPPKTIGVTVDQKREWLNTGTEVSPELQNRLGGLSLPVKTRKSSLDQTNETQKPSNQKWFSRNKRTTSESSSDGSSQSSNSPTNIRPPRKNSLKGILKPNSESSSGKLQKSPIEKSAKRMLSVNSPSSPSYSKDTFFVNNFENTEHKEQTQMRNNLSPDVQSKEPNGLKESLSRSKSEASGGKITSPSRTRKKTWGEKLTKKFKMIGSSSESPVSEYTCWNGEEPFDDRLPRRINHNVTPHNIHKNIGPCDSAILNRYHLDISMAHQRRISRQLLLDNATPDPSIKPLNLSQFQKHKPISMANTQPAVDGCLVLTLYGVRELKKTLLCEAYCIVQVDDNTNKRIGTTMQTCRGAVAWNQCFEMTVSQARELHLMVYTWETRGGKHKVSSRATVNLASLINGAKTNDTFAQRLAVRLEPRGTLYIKIGLEHSSSAGPLVFGADLQSIVDRENLSLGIPCLVHSCINEVEARGMQVVGIYRLCGSAIIKKNLRSDLESAKTEISLTSEHYPDVNVITGILKDFLRELPQPLFPPELLEAVTTAMDLNPGPTPVAVVKEPFAPNPSLISGVEPPQVVETASEEQKIRTESLLHHIHGISAGTAEQATLYALLNHLKRVSMHAHQNKMTCQNLAVCFGPVLLGPVNVGPAKGIDLAAAIGFKRHIQVLNYMLSNWPDTPVLPPGGHNNTGDNRRSSQRMSCVSLTRRLSRVCVLEEEEVEMEEQIGNDRSTLVSLGRSESLNSILEADDNFADPTLDYDNPNHFGDVGASLI